MDTIADYDDKIKLVIGDLLGRANDTVRKVLTAFDPSKDLKNIKAALLKPGISRKDLDACADFLGMDLTTTTGESLYSNRDKLAKRIVMEITALYPSFCSECSKEYSVKPGTNAVTRCYICLQGSHDCDDFVARHNVMQSTPVVLGTVWLCSGCYTANSPYPSGSNPQEATPKTPAWISMTNTPTLKKDKPPDKLPVDILAGKLLALKRQQDLEEAKEAKPNKCDNVCPLLMDGKCPHGVSGKTANHGIDACDKFHPPKRCHRFMRYGTKVRFGCTKGEECEFFHPRHCSSSLNDRYCYNQDCKLVHLCGTKRYRESRDRDQSNGQSYRRDRQTRSDNRSSNRNRDESVQQYRRPDVVRNRSRTNTRTNTASSGRVKDGPNPPRNNTDHDDSNNSIPPGNHHFLEIRSLLETLKGNFQIELEALKTDMAHHKTLVGQMNSNPTNMLYPQQAPAPLPSSQFPASSGLCNQTLLPQQLNFPQSQMFMPTIPQTQTNWAPIPQFSC